MEIKIYSQDGTLKLTASPGSGGQCVKQLQGDSELSLSFDYFSYVALDVNDYVDFCGDRYWLLEQYRPKEVSTIQWRYDVKLYGIESLIKRYLVIEHTDGDANPVFTLTAPASQHMRMIVECLNNATGTTDWQLGSVLTTGNITIDYTGKYCDEGLRELAEAANTEYWFSGDNGKTLNLCRCERGETIELKYGVGLISLERDVADNAKFYTRLYPVGSSRNINPETYGHTRLQLPNNQKYVDLDIARYGVIDHYEQDAFAGIYPRYTGTVSTVRVEDRTDEDGTEFKVYFIKDASLSFNPNNFLLPNEKIRISFQTGDLQGLGETDDHYFEADYNSTTGEFEIINIWTDGEQLPRPGLEPETGNSYIPWNISMPQTYITRAEQELAAAVSSYNQAHFVDNSVYRGTTNHVWIEADQTRNIYIGRLVKLVSDQYFPGTGYRNSRIVKITRRLDLPSQMELEISDAVSTGTLTKINDDIRGVWDFVKGLETDDNGKWLSKRHNDTAQGLIRFIRGLQVGERFVTGLLGEGGIFRKEADGTTYIEADKLYIRMKAYFDSVEILDYRHSAGNRIASEAGAKCCRVDWIDASGNSLKQTSENLASTVLFRCYFRGSDGEDEVRNNFIVGDLAYCHITTVETEDDSPIAKGLNKTHYWRLIVGRNAHGTLTDDGEHWIDLSNRVSETVTIGGTSYTRKGYQPGSDVPAAQNDIIQLGNIRDTDRQGAIIEFVTGADAPSYQIFQGIGSDVSNPYSLEGKNYVRFGYDSESGGAQVFIGNPDGSTYLWYHNVTEGGVTHPKLEIKAEVSLSSTFGGKSFEELVVEYAPEGWTEEEITQLIVDETDPMFSDIETALDTIQRQVDGSISTWFYGGTPTLSNQPASEWTTADLKNEHLGDLYYDNLTGYGYRFKYDETSRQWSWVRITDVDVTKALADAAKAQDTADHKRRVFVVQPTPPYDKGDLWVNATYPSGNTETNAAQNKYYNDVLRCKTAKASGTTFAIADWELASKYTDDTAFNNFFANTYQPFVTQIQSQVDGKAETWYQATDPSAAWNTSALRQAHIGDIWHNTSSATVSGVEAGQDAIWSGSDWKPSTVPQEVYDKIDGKADIFVSKPSTYNANDMWIIESGLASSDMPSGCVVGDIVISSAARKNSYTKSDWKKKDRYTDDSSLIAFIGGYTGTAQELQNQIDKKAETWYQATNPASASGWVAADHVGDLWYCTADISGTSYKAGTTWYYKDNGASASPRYAWVQQDIPDAVFDMIDGKAQIFVSQPSNYHAKDLWILAADTTVNGVACKQGEVLVASADSATYNQAHWSRKLRYTDDSALNTFLNGYAGTLTGITTLITNAQNAADAAQQSADDANALAATANYLKQAFLDNTGQAQTTDITGGLVLSTIVALRDANKKVWSGISGAYQAQETGTGYKGHGIAAWYGGGMVDGEVSTSSSNAAKSLFRFDGSGYVASKNISWDKNGNVTIQGYSINATTLQMGGSNVVTEGVLANYVTIATAQTITGAKTFGTADGSYIQIGAVRIVYDATNNALKIVGSNGSSAANLYATGSVSALGAGSGSSGGGDVTWALLASSSDTRQIALSHLTGALSGYATQSWVNSRISGMSTSLAGLSDVNVSGVTSGQYLKFNGQGWVPDTPSGGSGTVTAVKVGTTTYNPSSGVVSLPAYPTTLDDIADGSSRKLSDYVTLATAQTISNLKTMTHGLVVSGRAYNGGDDEGVIITPASNGLSGLILGSHSGRRSVFYLSGSGAPFWRYVNENGNTYNITHPAKGGTIALTSDIPTVPTKVSELTNDSGYITSSNSCASAGGLDYKSQITTASALDSLHWANQLNVYTFNGFDTSILASNGIIIDGGWTTTDFGFQILIDDDPSYIMGLRQRSKNGWCAWKQIPMGDGTGASGTWAISISGNADTVDGFHATCGDNKPWGTIPVIHSQGWIDIGRQIEFHFDNSTGSDYSTLLKCTGNYTNILNLPSSSGTIALTSDLDSYLPLTGGTLTGTLRVDAPIFGYNLTKAGANAAAFVFDKPGSLYTGIGAHATTDVIWFGACDVSGSWVDTKKQIWDFNGTIRQEGNAVIHAGNIASQTVASADKITTSRTLWGQSFNGTANVSGTIYLNENIPHYFRDPNTAAWRGGIYWGTNGNEAMSFVAANANTKFLFVNGSDIASWSTSTHTTVTPLMSIGTNVGIGVLSPSYKLHVVGTGYFTNSLLVQSVEIGNTNEINATGSSKLYLQYRNTGHLILCKNGKNIGVNEENPSYRLHVSGDIYATGAVTCLSDIREKNILGQAKITVEQIARMRSIVYRWKDNREDRDEHVGSIAQDWQNVLPQVVLTAKDKKKTLSMQYGVAALVGAITIARKVVDHERRIKELEDENRKLKEQLKIA